MIDPPTIVIDQQEKIPFTFERLPTVTEKLRTGDYSIKGLEHKVGIERKELGDLLGCIPNQPGKRLRFKREIMDLVGKPFHMLIIEATLPMIERRINYCRHCNGTGELFSNLVGQTQCHVCGGQRTVSWRSKVHPNAVLGTLTSWQARFGLRIIFGGTHAQCGRYVEQSLEKAFEEFVER